MPISFEVASKTDRFKKKSAQSSNPNQNQMQYIHSHELNPIDLIIHNNESKSKHKDFNPNSNQYKNLLHMQPINKPYCPSIATALLCEVCKMSFSPNEFVEHLNFCNNINGPTTNRINNNNPSQTNSVKNNQVYGFINSNFSSNKEYLRPKSVHCESTQNLININPNNSNSGSEHLKDPQIISVLENLNYEKKIIFDRLREVEAKLKQTENQNEMLNDEKENLRNELERLFYELKKTQMDWALSQDEREENENTLKNEIKFLINKLLKAKNKLSDHKNCSNTNLNTTNFANTSINMSGFLNFYQQNKDNSTFADKNENKNETSILNQSVQQMVSNSTITVMKKNAVNDIKNQMNYKNQNYLDNSNNKSKIQQRSKTPFEENKNILNHAKRKENALKNSNDKFNLCEKLDLNKYKRKK